VHSVGILKSLCYDARSEKHQTVHKVRDSAPAPSWLTAQLPHSSTNGDYLRRTQPISDTSWSTAV